MARRSNQRARGRIRDNNGVVQALGQRHPLLDVFTAIPLHEPERPQAKLPPINWPTELKQVVCIHVFENLYPGLPAPLPPGVRAHLVGDDGKPIVNERGEPVIIGSSKYRLVNPTGDKGLTMGGAGEHWLTWAVDAQAVQRATAETMAEVGPAQPMPDVGQMDEQELLAHAEQLRAQQLAIEERLQTSERANQLDVPIDMPVAPPPEWGDWTERNKHRLRPKDEGGGPE
ncbi:hypothetical protein SEA_VIACONLECTUS_36 [Gordonia phage ViaConlectus]|uniref:Uncharacterized protein n=1 Tax=Gordonia phage ViaConlectus TaxID=2972515 RepID=A0A976UF59_9CAUD|nr:hypothetical protein SEA_VIACONLECTUS_36 [Gordonia phage ViaConlectus]